MTGRITTVFGVSGVGKTWLIAKVTEKHPSILTVRASQLLADSLQQSTEVLRTATAADIAGNQDRLVAAFQVFRSKNPDSDIIFDGHVVIDNDVGLVTVPLPIITRLSPAAIAVIIDEPETICTRRNVDTRARPKRTVSDIEKQQALTLDLCRGYAIDLGIPFITVRSGDIAALESYILAAC